MSSVEKGDITSLCRQVLELEVEQCMHQVQALYDLGSAMTIVLYEVACRAGLRPICQPRSGKDDCFFQMQIHAASGRL
jgi:hypothetical protein